MFTSVTVFDIPHLLDSVCLHLDKKDIYRCLLVSRAWFSLFSDAYWRSLRIRGIQPIRSPHQKIVLEHAHLLRTLEAHSVHGAFLAKEGSECTRLRALTVREDWRVTYNEVRKDDPTFKTSALDLIALNPNLCRLELDGTNRSSLYLTDRLLESIASHPSLHSIRLVYTEDSYSTRSTTSGILRHLPIQLQDLQIDMPGEILRWDVGHWLPRPRTELRRLYIGADRIDSQVTNIVPLLAICPGLLDLSLERFTLEDDARIVNGIVKNCPSLERISLTHGLHLESALSLVRGLEHLREIRIGLDTSQRYPHALIPALVGQFGPRLEALDFRRTLRLTCMDLFMVLESCPRLRVLSVTGSQPDEEPWLGQQSLSDLMEAPWACTELETLELDVSDFISLDAADDRLGSGTEFLQIYRWLKSMQKLTQARLLFGPEEDISLDFKHSQLVRFSSTCLPEAFIHTSTLITFLLQNCPKLEELSISSKNSSNRGRVRVQDLDPCGWSCKETLSVLKIGIQDDEGAFLLFNQCLDQLCKFLPRLKQVQMGWMYRHATTQFDLGITDGKVTLCTVSSPGHEAFLGHLVDFVLTQCPELKKLRAKGLLSGSIESGRGGVLIKDLLRDEWVCRDIQQLELAISHDGSGGVDGEEEEEEEEEEEDMESDLGSDDEEVDRPPSSRISRGQQRHVANMLAQLVSRMVELPNLVSGASNRFWCPLTWISPVFEMTLETGLELMDERLRLTPRLVQAVGLGWKSKKQIQKETNEKKIEEWISESGMYVVNVNWPRNEDHQVWEGYNSSDEMYYGGPTDGGGSGDVQEEGQVQWWGQEEEDGQVETANVPTPFVIPEHILALYDDVEEEDYRPEELEHLHYKSRNNRRLQKGRF